MNIVEEIRAVVEVKDKPCLYLSGGLYSAIVLHHLREKYDGALNTYHLRFCLSGDEHVEAKRLADIYKTNHVEIVFDTEKYLDDMVYILSLFDMPRYNVWVYYLAEAAVRDGMKTVYLGEYSDEIFGGYNKSYLDGWAGHLSFGMPVYMTLHKHFKLDTEMPFMKLDWQKMLPCFAPPTKAKLREAYRAILPDFIINKAKVAPAFSERSYMEIWNNHLCKFYSGYKAENSKDVRKFLQNYATRAWIRTSIQCRLEKQS
jgi:asparagine synthetase B (glutamine-hydrolysing)